MNFQKFKTDSYCVGGRHRFGTAKINGDITTKASKVLLGYCSKCNRKKSMTVSDKTIQAEGLGSFFKKLGRISTKAGKKLATIVLKNLGRALEITSNIATAAATKSPKAALSSLPEMINSYQTGKGLYLGKIVGIILYIWKKIQNECTQVHL